MIGNPDLVNFSLVDTVPHRSHEPLLASISVEHEAAQLQSRLADVEWERRVRPLFLYGLAKSVGRSPVPRTARVLDPCVREVDAFIVVGIDVVVQTRGRVGVGAKGDASEDSDGNH